MREKRSKVASGTWLWMGLVLALWISSASVQDRDAGPKLVEPIHCDVPTVRKVWVDSGYCGEWRKEAKKWNIDVEVVERVPSANGFKLLSKRRIVERTWAWWNLERRLSKEYERKREHSIAWLSIAHVRLMMKRLSLQNTC